MFDSLLCGIRENEKVQVLEKISEIKSNGSEKILWKDVKEILCNIQANSKYGDSLSASEAGDKIVAVYNMYTSEKVVEGQRILRYNSGILYEIRNVEHNGVNTILEHYKAYLVRVDNQ